MLRKILAVVCGIISGSLLVGLIEQINHRLYPFPKGFHQDNMVAFKEYISALPVTGLLMVILGYALGAIAAGFISTKIAKSGKKTYALICGGIFLLFTIYNMIVLPTPVWFWFLGIAVWGLVLVGYQLALQKNNIR